MRKNLAETVFSTVLPTGAWICPRQMAWHREIGLEFGYIIGKSDNEPALTSLIESCSNSLSMTAKSNEIVDKNDIISSGRDQNEVMFISIWQSFASVRDSYCTETHDHRRLHRGGQVRQMEIKTSLEEIGENTTASSQSEHDRRSGLAKA